jgi:hypothetical protein
MSKYPKPIKIPKPIPIPNPIFSDPYFVIFSKYGWTFSETFFIDLKMSDRFLNFNLYTQKKKMITTQDRKEKPLM